MPKGIFGIEARPAYNSDQGDIKPASPEKRYNNPRHRAIAIVPQWDSPIIENGQFSRIPIHCNTQTEFGIWSVDGTFEPSPQPVRVWPWNDITSPAMLAKYPALEGHILGILDIIEAEQHATGLI
jgi:hypothetical protein